MDIVDDVILDTVEDDDFVLPKKPLLKRVANRFRAKKRPQEPVELEFEVIYSLRISIWKQESCLFPSDVMCLLGLFCGSLKHLYMRDNNNINPKWFRKPCMSLVVYSLCVRAIEVLLYLYIEVLLYLYNILRVCELISMHTSNIYTTTLWHIVILFRLLPMFFSLFSILQVNQDFLHCEEFLIGDIRVDTQRHFLLATEKQLNLLRSAKRWYMDGTFKVI